MSRAKRLLEYISNPLIWFRDYLNMPKDAKCEDMAYKFSYRLEDYYRSRGDEDKANEVDDSSVEALSRDERIKFGQWVWDNYPDGSYPDPRDPSYLFMDFSSIKHNNWMIHQSDDAWKIIRDGFMYGLEDYAELGLTTYIKQSAKLIGDDKHAYCFAYSIDDYSPRHEGRYGKEAVVFRASGVQVYHFGDQEYQTIFVAGTATDFVYVCKHEDGYGVAPKDTSVRDVVFKARTMGECLDWVAANYDQYRKAICQRERN
jgi:hypothetical protein